MERYLCEEDKRLAEKISATVVSIVCSRSGLAGMVRGERPPKQITHGLLDKVIVLVIDEYPIHKKMNSTDIDLSKKYV